MSRALLKLCTGLLLGCAMLGGNACTQVMAESAFPTNGPYGCRSPALRGRLNAKYGGTFASEQTVLMALRWLKKHQETDGSWVTSSGGGGDAGFVHEAAAPAMTGLALLAFLAHGETPRSNEFGPTVEGAIKWLVANQKPDGRFAGSDANEYSLPIATYALCEAYPLVDEPAVKAAAMKAVGVIISGQNPTWLWNYKCETKSDRNDLCYSSWCVQALKAASTAALENPGLKECMTKAVKGLRLSFSPSKDGGGCFTYARTGKEENAGVSSGLTGAGVLCLQLLGEAQGKEAKKGLQLLDAATCKWEAPWRPNPIYCWYYATQAKFYAGGSTWKQWNSQFSMTLTKNITIIPKAINDPKGGLADIGYWKPAGSGGNGKLVSRESCASYVYNTALCSLMLETYYRYPPISQGMSGGLR